MGSSFILFYVITIVFLPITTESNARVFKTFNMSLPQLMSGPTTAIYNNKIFLINGWPEIPYSYTTSIFLNESWKNKTLLNMPYNSYSVNYYGEVDIQINDTIYGIPQIYPTGTDIEYLGTKLILFNLIGNDYNDISTYNHQLLRAARMGCIANVDNILYICGGNDNGTIHNELQIYNISADQWSKGSSMLYSRQYHGCSATILNIIYVFGGNDWSTTDVYIPTSIEKYNITNDSWYLLSEELTTNRYLTTCVFSNYTLLIYCIGSDGHTTQVEIFDTITEQVVSNEIMINTIQEHIYPKVRIYDNYIYILGGYGNTFSELERYWLIPFDEYPTSEPTLPTLNPTIMPTPMPVTRRPTTKAPTTNYSDSDSAPTWVIPVGVVTFVVLIMIAVSICMFRFTMKRMQKKAQMFGNRNQLSQKVTNINNTNKSGEIDELPTYDQIALTSTLQNNTVDNVDGAATTDK